MKFIYYSLLAMISIISARKIEYHNRKKPLKHVSASFYNSIGCQGKQKKTMKNDSKSESQKQPELTKKNLAQNEENLNSQYVNPAYQETIPSSSETGDSHTTNQKPRFRSLARSKSKSLSYKSSDSGSDFNLSSDSSSNEMAPLIASEKQTILNKHKPILIERLKSTSYRMKKPSEESSTQTSRVELKEQGSQIKNKKDKSPDLINYEDTLVQKQDRPILAESSNSTTQKININNDNEDKLAKYVEKNNANNLRKNYFDKLKNYRSNKINSVELVPINNSSSNEMTPLIASEKQTILNKHKPILIERLKSTSYRMKKPSEESSTQTSRVELKEQGSQIKNKKDKSPDLINYEDTLVQKQDRPILAESSNSTTQKININNDNKDKLVKYVEKNNANNLRKNYFDKLKNYKSNKIIQNIKTNEKEYIDKNILIKSNELNKKTNNSAPKGRELLSKDDKNNNAIKAISLRSKTSGELIPANNAADTSSQTIDVTQAIKLAKQQKDQDLFKMLKNAQNHGNHDEIIKIINNSNLKNNQQIYNNNSPTESLNIEGKSYKQIEERNNSNSLVANPSPIIVQKRLGGISTPKTIKTNNSAPKGRELFSKDDKNNNAIKAISLRSKTSGELVPANNASDTSAQTIDVTQAIKLAKQQKDQNLFQILKNAQNHGNHDEIIKIINNSNLKNNQQIYNNSPSTESLNIEGKSYEQIEERNNSNSLVANPSPIIVQKRLGGISTPKTIKTNNSAPKGRELFSKDDKDNNSISQKKNTENLKQKMPKVKAVEQSFKVDPKRRRKVISNKNNEKSENRMKIQNAEETERNSLKENNIIKNEQITKNEEKIINLKNENNQSLLRSRFNDLNKYVKLKKNENLNNTEDNSRAKIKNDESNEYNELKESYLKAKRNRNSLTVSTSSKVQSEELDSPKTPISQTSSIKHDVSIAYKKAEAELNKDSAKIRSILSGNIDAAKRTISRLNSNQKNKLNEELKSINPKSNDRNEIKKALTVLVKAQRLEKENNEKSSSNIAISSKKSTGSGKGINTHTNSSKAKISSSSNRSNSSSSK